MAAPEDSPVDAAIDSVFDEIVRISRLKKEQREALAKSVLWKAGSNWHVTQSARSIVLNVPPFHGQTEWQPSD